MQYNNDCFTLTKVSKILTIKDNVNPLQFKKALNTLPWHCEIDKIRIDNYSDTRIHDAVLKLSIKELYQRKRNLFK